jgi:hypothetical protein
MKQVRRYVVDDVYYEDAWPEDEIYKEVCLSSDVAALESKLRALIEAAEDAADQMDECTDYCSLPLRAAIAKAKEDA